MKVARLCSVFVAVFSITASAANTDSIENYVKQIKPYVVEIETFDVRGATADQLLLDFATRFKGISKEELSIKHFPKSLPSVEAGEKVFGWTTPKLAASQIISESRIGDYNENAPRLDSAVEKRITALLAGSRRLGAKIGYTDLGAEVCGATIPSVLVLDVKAKKMYQFQFQEFGC